MRGQVHRFWGWVIYTDFHRNLPFLELDFKASAKCRYQSHHSMDNQQKQDHLVKIVIPQGA
jgi:hypothetical protein